MVRQKCIYLGSLQMKVFIEDLPKGKTPICTYCRELIDEGVDPSTEVYFYRQNKPEADIIVKHLGRAAKITVKDDARGRPTFVKYKKMGVDSLKRLKGSK
jgi:hypothetical protein